MKNLIYLLTAFIVFSCSPPESESDICIDNMIQLNDMEHYAGEMSGDCITYLRWFIHDGNDYFMMDNPCADFALHLWNCDKVDVCHDNSSDCQEILSEMTAQGIVGRDPQ